MTTFAHLLVLADIHYTRQTQATPLKRLKESKAERNPRPENTVTRSVIACDGDAIPRAKAAKHRSSDSAPRSS
jgi:hypothetical protein